MCLRGRAGRWERALARGESALIEGDLGTERPELLDPAAVELGARGARDGAPLVAWSK